MVGRLEFGSGDICGSRDRCPRIKVSRLRIKKVWIFGDVCGLSWQSIEKGVCG